MNIFYLDKDCVTSAKYHTDKHVVKMILEYSQLLCTAHRLLDTNVDDRLYRATHKNHPSAKFVRYTDSNYMFVYNMFLRPSVEELDNFEEEWLVLCAPGYECTEPEKYGLRQGNFSVLNFTKKIALIGGSAYTGEMKKGIFSALNMILPVDKNVLPMHCSANIGEKGDTALFFGLSGTGKTTLSADPKRRLIGDDEHGWTAENSIFNFEGGCYAKVIDLTEEKEPDIYRAIKPGAILENVIFKSDNTIDFMDSSITQNTRVSYPIYHIDNIPVSYTHLTLPTILLV